MQHYCKTFPNVWLVAYAKHSSNIFIRLEVKQPGIFVSWFLRVNNKALKSVFWWNQPPWSSCDGKHGCECESVACWWLCSVIWWPLKCCIQSNDAFAANSLEVVIKSMCFFSFCKAEIHTCTNFVGVKPAVIWVNLWRNTSGSCFNPKSRKSQVNKSQN